MATGKSVIGRHLAKRIGFSFVDVDERIETKAGMKIANIFKRHGELFFRKLERECVLDALGKQGQVLATGGGAFVDPQLREQMKDNGKVVCLTSRPEAILARVQRRLHARPLLSGAKDPLQRIRELLHDREAAYRHAHLTVDTSDESASAIAGQIADQLKEDIRRSEEG